MEIDRAHRTTTTTTTTTPTTSELLICFTSRLSHSSMRISSKSILSPARPGDKPTGSNPTNLSLTTSLSRRLRHSGSLRGAAGSTLVAQSPSMLVNKKSRGGGGSGFDNPEPSSPKVTCIGQVRVKTKKQGKKMKMRACRSKSRRLSGGSEASFRRFDGGGLTPQNSLGGSNSNQDRNLRNQRWVHLPVTICDAIRAFGNEFSCLIPCKSSCFSSSNEGGSNGCDGDERRDGYGACGAVCSWLVAMHDGEEERGRRRDIELVVGDGGEERMECSRRRSIFDDMEFKDEFFDVKNGGEVSGGRVSICAPPKNALLLMRCRSDPMKVSALSQKIWEAPVVDFDSEEEKEEEGEDDKVIDNKVEDCEDVKEVCMEGEKCGEVDEICEDVCVEVDEEKGDECEMEGFCLDIFNEEAETEELMEEGEDKQGEECEEEEVVLGEEKVENGDGEESEVDLVKEEEEEEEEISEESNQLSCISSVSSVEESTAESVQENDQVNEHESGQEMVKSVYKDQEEEEETPLEGQSHQEGQNKSKWEVQVQKQEKGEEIKRPVLPECLLLMMCEPKLSMEVSKETWVCSTDFIRWLPERHQSKKLTKIDGSDEPKKKKSGGPAPVQPVKPLVQVQVQVPVQQGRSSISFPTGGGPVGKMVEPKLVKAGGGGGGIEPFVLTRCRSAPMRSAGKNGPPELPCSLWRRESSRKIEPHRASFGATGVGF